MVKKPTVSIVTISQWKRFNCLEILRDLIKDQTYKNTIEWVIVEGSSDEGDALKNAEAIKALESKIPIVYLGFESGLKLGALRNKGNEACKGDITVVMDDDDYYPPERIEHAVEKLNGTKAQIAGCSAMYIYDYFLQGLYKFREFGPNHSTNNCMAWKKDYLKKNKHDPEKDSGEETSFTFGFKEPMVQLDPEKTIVVSSHDSNTYNKRELLVGGTHGINKTIFQVDQKITEFIKEPYFSRLKSIFYKETVSPYDIVYFTGGFSSPWDPKDLTLGGSEQAVVHLTTEWSKKGKKVAVYGQVPDMTYNGVDYMDWKKFPFEAKHNVVIVWRLFGLLCSAPFPIKANHLWHDTHDNLKEGVFPKVWQKYGKVFQKIFFKSHYHRSEFETHSGEKLNDSLCVVIPNGLRVKEFQENRDGVQRNPYRFCYCSCYMRGLAKLLQFVWPIIYKIEPRAELHVYYGMNAVKDEGFKNGMLGLLSQPGVMDHGRQPMDIIIREKYMSNFHLYISETTAEIDCISIRESLITGAIPLISNFGLFKGRPGIHFDITDQSSFQMIGLQISEILKKHDTLDAYRNELKKSALIVSWEQIAQAWLDLVWTMD